MVTKRTSPGSGWARGLAIVSLLAAFSPAAGRAAAQAGAQNFFISQVDSSAFPKVSFTLRAANESGQPVPGLNNALRVFENGQPVPSDAVQVVSRDDAPINYLFVVDQGQFTNYSNFGLPATRQIFSTLVDGGYFVDGRDKVTVLVRQHTNSDLTEVRLPATSSRDEFLNFVATFPFERRSLNPTRGLEAVGDALAEAGRQVSPPGSGTVAVFFISRRIEDPVNTVAVQGAESLARDARAAFISVNTFHLENSATSKQPLEALALGTGGQYVVLSRKIVPTQVGAVYQAISALRTLYTVSYTSQQAGSDPRTITINAPQAAAGQAGSYQVAVAPPQLALTNPQPGAVLTRARQDGALTPLKVDVLAALTWPDGHPRALQSVRLLVNGVDQGAAPAPAGTDSVKLSANLADITTPGSNAVTLEVEVTDGLGLSSSARVDVTVAVELEAPTATPAPTTPIGLSTEAALAVLAVVLCGGVLVLALGVGIGVFLWRRRASAAPPPPPPPPPPEPESQATMIISRPRAPGAAAPPPGPATLTVLQGPPGREGEVVPLKLSVTRLGRNPQVVDVVFYPEGDSSVSRLHCAIELVSESAYRLVDKGSTSGTRVNGRPVTPEAPAALQDGDEIVLGEPARRGVRLRFSQGGPGSAAGGPAREDRTRIIRRSEPPA